MNEEFLLRKKYANVSSEFARTYDEVTLNVEKQMKIHAQLCRDYTKLKTDYDKLKIEYERTAKFEDKCEEVADQSVVETKSEEGNAEDKLPLTLLNMQEIMLLQSLRELKETVSEPSDTQQKEGELKVETVDRPEALDFGRRKLAEYVSMESDLRCVKLEKVLAEHRKRHVSVAHVIGGLRFPRGFGEILHPSS